MAYQPNVEGAESKVLAHILEGREEKPTRMKVYNEKLFETLLASPDPGVGGMGGLQKQGSGSDFGVGKSQKALEKAAEKRRTRNQREAKQRRYNRHKETIDRLHADNATKVKAKLADNQANREKKFEDLMYDVKMGKELTEEADRAIALYDTARRLKTEKQFDEWNTGVYGHLQEKICEDLDRRDYKELQRQRNQAFQDYLDTSNKKGGAVFRDIIIESEYDPLAPNRGAIRVRGGRALRDPTRRVNDRHHEEQSLLAEGRVSREPKVRETLRVGEWATGKIEATSHGFMHKMMHRNPSEHDGKPTHSTIAMDHYNIEKSSKFTNQEFPIGKRIFPEHHKSDQIQLG